ncbi:MAG: PorP/SprF family type IX secretion system membrane protein [Flavipsychrobacter sp.]|nr:PorP/SprF family type IX secretion system membrane protein [Flavipsychrobacter sp.]
MNKKTFYKKILTLLCSALCPVVTYAQADIHFSQFYETSILRNPALTGVFSEDYKFSAVYRNQWSSITNPFETALVSAESKIKIGHGEQNDFFSYGALVYYDKAGSIDSRIIGAYPAINYSKAFGDAHNSYLSAGFTGGIIQHSFDPSKATFNNQYQNNVFNASNPTGENLPNPKLTLYDVGAGINFNSSSGEYNSVTYMLGVSGYHFTQPNNSYYKSPNINLNMRFNVNMALSGHFNESYSYQLQGNFALQGSYYEAIAGGLVGWNRINENDLDPEFAIYAGAFYRYGDAIIPTFKLRFKTLAFGLSYDVNVSGLNTASSYRGGYEISLIKTGHFFDKNSTNGKPLCPNFY